MSRLGAALVGLAFATAVGSAPASAAAVYTFLEVGGSVVGTLSGSLDLTGSRTSPAISLPGAIIPSIPAFIAAPTDGLSITLYPAGGPTSFGTGTGAPVAYFIGTLIQISGWSIALANDYVSGSPMSGTTIITGSFAAIGVTPGSYVWEVISGDTFTLRFTRLGTAIPAPASLPVLAGALSLLAFTRLERGKGHGSR